jgi:hypothetical protein
MSETSEFFDEEIPSQIYHYTGKAGFLGIIKNKCFWASHILFQNDRSEHEIAFELLKNKLSEKTNDKINNETLDFAKSFLSMDCFTVSFSEKEDNLEQFRGYATDTPGFCLGIKTDKFKECLSCNSTKKICPENHKPEKNEILNNSYKFRLAKCIYDLKKQNEIIDKIVDNVLTESDINEENACRKITDRIIPPLLEISPCFKNKNYENEKEWRLIISQVHDKSKIKEKVGKSYFIPYFELNFCTEICIGDVIIGPCIDEKITQYSVSRVLANYGIEFMQKRDGRNLRHSSIPYRYW